MIRINALTKRFGRTVAADGVSLEIRTGEAVALWGPNGAGKTTIIRCVLGLLRFRGGITVCGLDVRRFGKRSRRLIGYVPQELGIYDDLALAEAVRFFARLKGIRGIDPARTLAQVGLGGNERKRVRELSGGMRQRLALALAMLGDPPVLILDEVTANLDARGREEFIALLVGLRGGGRAVLFASHRMEEVSALATRAALLDRGRLTAEVSPRELLSTAGAGAALHLYMPADAAGRARALLAERGYDSRPNGAGLVVPVRATDKAVPFRILAEGRIPVEDFDLVPVDGSVKGRTP